MTTTATTTARTFIDNMENDVFSTVNGVMLALAAFNTGAHFEGDDLAAAHSEAFRNAWDTVTTVAGEMAAQVFQMWLGDAMEVLEMSDTVKIGADLEVHPMDEGRVWHLAAAHCLALAQEERNKAWESYERCQEDGFRTQAMHQGLALMWERQAELEMGDGMADFQAIFTAKDIVRQDGQVIPAGTLIPATLEEGRYGFQWVIFEAEAAQLLGTRWLSESKAKDPAKQLAAHQAKGFYVGTVRVKVEADIYGTNMGGCGVTLKRLDGGFSKDAKVTDNGQ